MVDFVRLTTPNGAECEFSGVCGECDEKRDACRVRNVVNRLSEYENIPIPPEEVMRLKKAVEESEDE